MDLTNEPSMLVLVLDIIGRFLMPITLAFAAAAMIGISWGGTGAADSPRNAEINIGFATSSPSK